MDMYLQTCILPKKNKYICALHSHSDLCRFFYLVHHIITNATYCGNILPSLARCNIISSMANTLLKEVVMVLLPSPEV